MSTARLDRLLVNLGYGSRREVHQLIAGGAVVLDGITVQPAAVASPVDADRTKQVTIRGEPLDPLAPLTLMMHKPVGLVCSHAEPGRSVYDLLPVRWRRRRPPLSTIGRLDADATGLLLITDDGHLNHAIASPRRHLRKRYRVTLAEPIDASAAPLFASGRLRLSGEERPLAPATLKILSSHAAELVVTEGRHHQVKRMFAAIGNRVLALHRDRIGGLALPGELPPGSYRPLSGAERNLLAR